MNIDIVSGKSKKTGKEYEAVRVQIGDWSSLLFPRTRFEMEYIKRVINGEIEK